MNEELIAAWMDYLSSHARAAQLLGKDSDVVSTLEHALTRHLKDVRRHAFKPDKRSVSRYMYVLITCAEKLLDLSDCIRDNAKGYERILMKFCKVLLASKLRISLLGVTVADGYHGKWCPC